MVVNVVLSFQQEVASIQNPQWLPLPPKGKAEIFLITSEILY